MKKALLCLLVSVTGFVQAGTKPTKNPVVAPAPAADDSLGFSLMAGYDSAYIFRGVKYGDNLISTGLTMPFKLTDKATLTLSPWYGTIAGEKYDELDLPISLTYDLGFVTAGVGYTWYYYAFSGFNTSEPNFTLSKTVAGFNWYAGAYLDVNADGGDLFANKGGSEGWYFETGVNYPIKITEKFQLVPEVKISYGDKYYGVSGFNNVIVKLTAPIALTKTATLAPYIAGSFAIDSLEELGVQDYLVGGVALTVTF